MPCHGESSIMIMLEHKLISSTGPSIELLSMYGAMYFKPINRSNSYKTEHLACIWHGVFWLFGLREHVHNLWLTLNCNLVIWFLLLINTNSTLCDSVLDQLGNHANSKITPLQWTSPFNRLESSDRAACKSEEGKVIAYSDLMHHIYIFLLYSILLFGETPRFLVND